MISYKTCVVVSKVSKRVFPYYIWILIIYCSFKKREVKLGVLWGGLYPSAEKLDPISIPRGSLGGMGDVL
jgi:hypothetical protein